MNSAGSETTYHVGDALEKVASSSGTTDFRHYVRAGNELVAIKSRIIGGNNTVRYVLSDHQGSIAGIDSSAGAAVVPESFTAYGNRRSGETWSGAPTSGDKTTINGMSRWGSTGETVLGVSMGLNHLNGRIEDSITGRFLSPDPYVPEPGNTQSFNRYSYARNNPVTFIDPSGFDDAPVFEECGTTVTGSPPPSDSGGDGGGDVGGFTGGFSPYQSQVYNAGLWGVTNLTQGFNIQRLNSENSILLRNPGRDTLATIDQSGAETPWDPSEGLQESLAEIQVTSTGYSRVSLSDCGIIYECGFTNYNGFGRAATRINLYRVLGQFAAISVGGSAGFAFKGTYAGSGAGLAPDSAVGYILNTGTNVFSVGLGP